MNPQAYLVAAFIVAVILALYSVETKAGPTIGLGQTFNKSSLSYGEVGYEWKDWEATAGKMGEGQTDYGRQEPVNIYSLSRLVRPGWCIKSVCNYFRVGVSKVHGSPLVGEDNYRLGIGIEHTKVQVEYVHFSSAGIYENNGGIDAVMLRLKF